MTIRELLNEIKKVKDKIKNVLINNEIIKENESYTFEELINKWFQSGFIYGGAMSSLRQITFTDLDWFSGEELSLTLVKNFKFSNLLDALNNPKMKKEEIKTFTIDITTKHADEPKNVGFNYVFRGQEYVEKIRLSRLPAISKSLIGTFQGCTNLTSITTYHNQIKCPGVGETAFEGCENLQFVSFAQETFTTTSHFEHCPKLHNTSVVTILRATRKVPTTQELYFHRDIKTKYVDDKIQYAFDRTIKEVIAKNWKIYFGGVEYVPT